MTSDPASRIERQCRFPHELLMVNLAAFHLLLAPAAIALDIGILGLLLTPALSGIVILYIYLRGKRLEHSGPWIVMAHWKLAWGRCRLLLLGYAGSFTIIGGGWLLSTSAASANMAQIIVTVATRIGVMPTVVVVLIAFVLSNGGLDLANRGEVPGRIKRRYPPEEPGNC